MIPVIYVTASWKTGSDYIYIRPYINLDESKMSSWSVIFSPLHVKSIAGKHETARKCLKRCLKA